MPLYEYQCTTCSQVTEVLQKISDPPLAVCGSCGGGVKKLISSPAIQFKGSGFYITDYARGGTNGNGNASKKETAPAKSDTAAGTGSSASSDKN
jgi:putative FmdB family regulatory protein